ncbi:MAG: hypothetical protein FWG39_03245 [Alphaproteobacteria bacterium]|nr:hypothetical protein [Alphaproteobacteria bacterium]
MKKRFYALCSMLYALPSLTAVPAVAAPAVVGLIATGLGIAGVAGFSIYRSFSPVNMADAQRFFSSCWTCDVFGDILRVLSDMLPTIYGALGGVMFPVMLGLAALWISWNILASWIGAKGAQVDATSGGGAWTLAGKSVALLVKITFVSALFFTPLPRIITTAFVEPVFNTGLSLSRGATREFAGGENLYAFEACLVATAIEMDSHNAGRGAFSPKFRHSLTCQLGGIHQMTGVGMAVGWTMLNASFQGKYMHKFIFGLPIFPHVGMFVAGAIIMFMFLMGLIPIPLYFLETLVRLSLNLAMFPLFLLGWTFEGWKIMPDGTRNIRETIDDLIRDVVGIAAVLVFVVFAIMFLDAVIGGMDGGRLAAALADEKNGSDYLIDGLFLNNDSMVTVMLSGIFIAFFMTSIPAIVKSLFAKISIPDKYYETAKKDAAAYWDRAKKLYAGLKK